MGRRYRVPFSAVAVTAQQDFFEIVSASTKVTRLLGFHLSQSTEVGDAAEEGLSVLVKSGATVSGSGGSSVTPVPVAKGDAAFAGTCEANNTTKANTGTIVTHLPVNWNIRVPLDVIFTPEMVIDLPPSERLTIELATTPADSITISGYADIEEVG